MVSLFPEFVNKTLREEAVKDICQVNRKWLTKINGWYRIYLTGQPEGECNSPAPAKVNTY